MSGPARAGSKRRRTTDTITAQPQQVAHRSHVNRRSSSSRKGVDDASGSRASGASYDTAGASTGDSTLSVS